MERGEAFSIMLGRLQHELCRGYGVDNARKVLQGALDSNDVVFARLTRRGAASQGAQHRLLELLADEQASTLKVSAIPCASAEHAEAARQVFGESDQRH